MSNNCLIRHMRAECECGDTCAIQDMIDDETKDLRDKIAVLETHVERARIFAEFFLDEFRFDAAALADWAAQGDNNIDDLVVWAKELRK